MLLWGINAEVHYQFLQTDFVHVELACGCKYDERFRFVSTCCVLVGDFSSIVLKVDFKIGVTNFCLDTLIYNSVDFVRNKPTAVATILKFLENYTFIALYPT